MTSLPSSAFWAVAATAVALVGHESATSGHVTAKLAYRETSTHAYAVSILVVRRGRLVYNKTVPSGRDAPYGAAVAGQHSVTVADLDANGEPEILVDFWSRQHGLRTLLYHWLPKRKTYAAVAHAWGAAGYRLADLRNNGGLEFQSGDPRFASQFAVRAYSRLPLQVWQWTKGRVLNVTRRFLPLVRADAAAQSAYYANLQATPGYPLRGAVAAWVADEALLGQGTQALQHVRQIRAALSQPPDARRGSFDAFYTHLRTSLKKWGYLK